MTCNNDWDELEEIIVGTATSCNIPEPNISIMKCQFPEYEEEYIKSVTGCYPKQIIDEQNEDLEILSNTLKSLGVKVYRPDTTYADAEIKSPTWRGKNWQYYSPRDLTFIVDDIIIETPSPLWNRQFETWGYREIFTKLFKEGYKWLKAPVPILFDENYKEDTKGIPSLNNEEILFEAANCVRANKDILYQISNTGNRLGGEWLQSIVGDQYKVHIVEGLYSYAHLDSTILPVREGLVVYNASRVTPDNEPEIFKSWDKIWINKCVGETIAPVGLPWGASEWIGMNFLSVNPNLAIVDKKQTEIHKKLNAVGIETIPLELRHDRLLAGGFHCVTLDLKRKRAS
jgi:N-dimethylarginine dimethylaminohydrolase